MIILRLMVTACVAQVALLNCRFGPGCAFKCSCQNNAPCDKDTGHCNNGCDYGPGVTQDVKNMRYVGPGCQIGNIAFQRLSSQSSVLSSDMDAPQGNDGNTSGIIVGSEKVYSCIHTDGQRTENHWWTVFLENLHIIYNVTVFGRTDELANQCSYCRTNITVMADERIIGVCGQCNLSTDCPSSPPYSPFTFHCVPPLRGNKVTLQKVAIKVLSPLVFCEAVVFGNPYVDVSWEHCLNSSIVDNYVTGCPYCSGRKLPDCKQDCDDGSYGINCNEACGHCYLGGLCSKSNGSCGLSGCDTWWHGDTCHREIVKIGYNSIDKAVVEVTPLMGCDVKYAKVTWNVVDAVSDDLELCYEYEAQYRITTDVENKWQSNKRVKHSEKNATGHLFTVLYELEWNTTYAIRIVPYRISGDFSERGGASAITLFAAGEDHQKSGSSGVPIGIIAGVSVAVIIILVLVSAGFVYWRLKRPAPDNRSYQQGNTATDYQQPT